MAEHESTRPPSRHAVPDPSAVGAGRVAAQLAAAPPVHALAATGRKLNAAAPKGAGVVQAISRGANTLRVQRNPKFNTRHVASDAASRATAFNGRNPRVPVNTTATKEAWTTAVNAKADNVTDLGGKVAVSVQGSDTSATGPAGALVHTAVGALNKTVAFSSDHTSVTLKHLTA